jgi:hypothetical protein
MMNDTPPPGWWLASDGNYYPPALHPSRYVVWVQPQRVFWGTAASAIVFLIAGLVH